jgi:hypothetical protein
MKLNPFLAPTSKPSSSKKLIVKKLCSTAFTMLVLAGGMLLFDSASYRSSPEPLATAIAAPVSVAVPLGLSCRRGAFNKAIDILADAAETNPRLVHYYNRVAKRVRGAVINGEDNSGESVAKSAHKVNRSTVAAKAATNIPSQAASEGSITRAPGVVAHLSIAATSNDDPSELSHRVQQRYTVGDMAFDMNAAIEYWMNYYSATPGGRRTMMVGIGRSDSYLEMARAEFRSAGVPEDLVWLAFVESVWNPRAVSPAAAGGIWQFIPSTATDYGLTVQSGNDERADPFKQTRVAATYLRDLYTIFGDWSLAMAAYNSGEPRVMGAIVKNGRANFWDLYNKQLLPKETRDYVPKILAAIKIASQAETYGLAPQANSVGSAGS